MDHQKRIPKRLLALALQSDESSSYSHCPVLRALSSVGISIATSKVNIVDFNAVTLYVITQVLTGLYSRAIKASGIYKRDCLLCFPPAEPKSWTSSKSHLEGGGAFSMQI